MNAKTAIQLVCEDNAEDALKAHDASKIFSIGDLVRSNNDGGIGKITWLGANGDCIVGSLVVDGQLKFGGRSAKFSGLEAATDADKRFWREVTRLKVGDKVAVNDGSLMRGVVAGVNGDMVKVKLSKTRRIVVYRENELRRQHSFKDL